MVADSGEVFHFSFRGPRLASAAPAVLLESAGSLPESNRRLKRLSPPPLPSHRRTCHRRTCHHCRVTAAMSSLYGAAIAVKKKRWKNRQISLISLKKKQNPSSIF